MFFFVLVLWLLLILYVNLKDGNYHIVWYVNFYAVHHLFKECLYEVKWSGKWKPRLVNSCIKSIYIYCFNSACKEFTNLTDNCLLVNRYRKVNYTYIYIKLHKDIYQSYTANTDKPMICAAVHLYMQETYASISYYTNWLNVLLHSEVH